MFRGGLVPPTFRFPEMRPRMEQARSLTRPGLLCIALCEGAEPRSDLRKRGLLCLSKSGGEYEIRTREGLPQHAFQVLAAVFGRAVCTFTPPGPELIRSFVNDDE
jgi:hypothetical protein